MSSDRDTTRIVQSWLEEGVNVLPDRVLDGVLGRLPATPQRRRWWQAWRNPLMSRSLTTALASAAVVAVLVVGIGLYLNQRNAITPGGSPSPGHTSTPVAVAPTSAPSSGAQEAPATPVATAEGHGDAPFVVFIRMLEGEGLPEGHLWAMRADGTDARAIWPDSGSTINVAWSDDGSQLLAVLGYQIYLAEVSDDGIGPFIDTGFDTGGEDACDEKSAGTAHHPCQDWDVTFAPDGERIAVVQTCTYIIPGCGFITTIDLRTGERKELSATLDDAAHPGADSSPAWSPDGSEIAYTRETDWRGLGEGETAESNLYVTDASGQNERKIDVPGVRVQDPSWSADGATIAFHSDNWVTDSDVDRNIYTIRTDGSDLRQLTTDGNSAYPEWTPSNQIRFTRGETYPDLGTFYVMDADDGKAVLLADLRDELAAIEPPGTVTNVWPQAAFGFQLDR